MLRDPRVTSVLIGASRPEQLEDTAASVTGSGFTADELAAIDEHSRDGGLNIWAASSEA